MKSQPSITSVFTTLALDLGLEKRDVDVITRRAKAEGDAFFTKTLPLLGKALDQGFSLSRFYCPTNFRRKSKNSAIPALLGSLISKVFSATSGALLDDADPVAIYQVRQFVFFFYKADIPPTKETVDATIDSFVKTEEYLSSLKIDEDAIVKSASLFAEAVFGAFDAGDVRGNHGPGVTANCPVSQKYEAKMSAAMPVVTAYSRVFFFNEGDALDRLSRYPTWGWKDLFQKNNRAKVILVPKDSRGPRIISAEPWENMYIQQGLRCEMEKLITANPLTRGQINFKDQSTNQRLAIEASTTQRFSTLDLKDASDRVHLDLVKYIFKGVPELLCSLLSSRSESTLLPDGRTIKLRKFAPMGSSVCFTVLSFTVWSLATSYILGVTGDLHLAAKSVYVFGDDIIVPTEHALGVISVLERYGLLVNRQKSFINSRFAESCGVDSFDGNVVTPVRVKRWNIPLKEAGNKTLSKKGQSVIVSTVKTAQLLSASGLSLTAELFYKFAEKNLGILPYCSFTSGYLGRWTWQTSLIPEMNILRDGLRWKREEDLNRFPLGYSLRAVGIRALKTKVHTTGYGHASRIWPSLGRDEIYDPLELPSFGEFNLPRDWRLQAKYFDHYAMT